MIVRLGAVAFAFITLTILITAGGDFGIERAWSQTQSTSRTSGLTDDAKQYIRLYSDVKGGDITIFSDTDFVITPDTLPGDDGTPQSTGEVSDSETNFDEDVEPIFTQEYIEQVADPTTELKGAERETVVETVTTLTEIADTVSKGTRRSKRIRPASTLSEECLALGARNRRECDSLLTIAFLPDVCLDRGIKTKGACDTYLVTMNEKPEDCENATDSACRVLVEQDLITSVRADTIKLTIQSNLSEYCTERGATTLSQCERIKKEKLVPLYCREAGATSEEECERLIKTSDLSQECIDAGITSHIACDRHLFLESKSDAEGSLEVPDVCVKHNVSSIASCKMALKTRVLHPLCFDAGIETSSTCDAYLIQNTLQDYCTDQGSDSLEDCRDSLEEELKEQVRCEGLRSESCSDNAVQKHFGRWIGIKKEFETKKQAFKALRNTAAHMSELPLEAAAEVRKSLINDRQIFLQATEESVSVNRQNELLALSSAGVVLDDDGDGLSNELEIRIGTDINSADTDGDGFDDKTELKGGFNPSGEGEIIQGLWPVDNAMIYGLPLQHPASSIAPTDDTFDVNLPANTETGDGIVLSGSATANALVTLFVYSPMPMVLTVETDSNGNWNYILQESLTDGEHEVYVALINDVGEIERQSRPLSFFINEARAVTIDEFFGIEEAPPVIAEVPVDNLRTYYLIGAGALILIILIIVIVLIVRARKKDDLPPPPDSEITT